MRRSMHKRLAAAATATLVTFGLVACGDDAIQGHDAVAIGGQFEFVSPGGQTVIEYDPEDRAPIADVFGPDLMNTDEEIDLADFEGEMVVLNAWGQWCAPCRSETDDLQAVHEKMQEADYGTLLGINVRDNVISAPQDFKEDNGVTYPSIYDPPFMNAAALGGVPASVIPTTIVLDREHRPAVVILREITEFELWDFVEQVATEEA